MYNYNKTQVSPYDHTNNAIHSLLCPEGNHISNCGPDFKKTVLFNVFVHFIDEETNVDFDCLIT